MVKDDQSDTREGLGRDALRWPSGLLRFEQQSILRRGRQFITISLCYELAFGITQ